MTSTPDHDVTVWYDGDCPLCLREISLMKRIDKRRRINFVEIQSAASCPVSTDELMARFHAQERGAHLVSGAEAFAAMWRAIPLLRPFGLLARFKPVLAVLEWLYVRFLTIRPWLQRRFRAPTSI